MSGVTIQIEKLGKENYDTWRQQIEAVIVNCYCWDFVAETKVKPAVIEANAENAAEVTANLAAINEWQSKDRKAKANLVLSIKPSELCHIKHCKTSNEVWKKLEQVFQSSGPAKKAALLKKLLFSKMGEGDNMADHITNFVNTVDKLNEMEILISEDLLSKLLLYSIPKSYDNFRCAIETRDELPKIESLKIKLIEEASSRTEKQNGDEQKALQAKNSYKKPFSNKNQQSNKNASSDKKQVKNNSNDSNNNSKENKSYKNIKCNYCHKIGHLARNC